MAKHLLSKSTYIKSLQCQKSLYLHKKRPFLRDKMSAVQLAKFRRGTAVGVLARDLFPGGIDMTPKSPSQYQAKRDETLLALQNPEITAIYEAVFQYDEVLIMLDILVREGDKWRAIEVKSSRGLSETYLQDAYLQYYVLKGNLIPLLDFELFYLNEEYVLGDELNLQELFISQSVMNQAEEVIDLTALQIKNAKETLQLTKSPEVPIGTHCYKPYPCDFIGHCWKNVPQNSLLYLSSEKLEQRFKWYNQGVELPEQSENYYLKEQIEALNHNTYYLNKQIFQEAIKSFKLTEPTYLKFLIHHAAVPTVSGRRPYEAVVLAVCAFQPHNKQQQIFYWNNAKQSDGPKLADFLNQIWLNSSCLIVYENNNLDVETKKLSGLNTEIQWLNYTDLLDSAHFMFPAIEEKYELNTLQNHLFPELKPLKEEAWLLKDLLEEPEKNSAKVNFQLSQYCQSLHKLHHYFLAVK